MYPCSLVSTLSCHVAVQDCYPARFCGVHFLSQPWYVEALLSVIRPFLKDKVKDKVSSAGTR